MKKPKKTKKKDLHIWVDEKLRNNFFRLCAVNRPRTDMTKAIVHYMDLCVKNREVLGLGLDK